MRLAPIVKTCVRGHVRPITERSCRICKRDREREYRSQTKQGLEEGRTGTRRKLPPPAVNPEPRFMLSREELAREREESIKRQQKIVKTAMDAIRDRIDAVLPEEVTGGLPFTGGRRFQYARRTCEVRGDRFYRKRGPGRPAKRCADCKRAAAA